MRTKNIVNLINTIREGESQINQRLKGQVIVITGATGMIGRTVSKELFNNGGTVVLFARDTRKLHTQFEKLDKERVLLVSGEASKEKDVQRLFKLVEKKYGRVDVLVNCLGIFSSEPVEELCLEKIEKVFDANVRTIFITCCEAVKLMKKHKNGTIINLGSRITRNSNVAPNKILYTSSKYAIEGFSVALSRSVSKDNIRVICLLPATVSTFITKDILKYMLPKRIAQMVLFILSLPDVSFDPISFKSVRQNI